MAEEKTEKTITTKSLIYLYIGAVILRMVGILWDGTNADEMFGVAAKVLAGQIIPDNHLYPAFFHYLVAFSYALMFVLGSLIGVWSSIVDFKAQYFSDPTPFYFSARMVTVLITSTMAPVVALMASRLRIDRRLCLLAGGLTVLFPLSIWLSHISKSGFPMASMCVAVGLAYIYLLERPSKLRSYLVFSFVVMLTLSLKQSALFFVLPLALFALGYLLTAVSLPPKIVARYVIISVFAAFIGGVIINIGTILDWRNFLDYQIMQSQMSIREGRGGVFFQYSIPIIFSLTGGATPLITLLFLTYPFVFKQYSHRTLWLSSIIGLTILILMAGERVRPALLAPYSTLMFGMGCVVLASLFERPSKWIRCTGYVALILVVLNLLWGANSVLSQALQPSVSSKISALVKEKTRGKQEKILSSVPLRLPISLGAYRESLERQRFLASKYKIKLPNIASERAERFSENGYFVTKIPFVMGGMEYVTDETVKVVKPFSYPIQQEWFYLDYWLREGYTLFVTSNEEYFIRGDVSAYGRLHREIRDRCILIDEIQEQRELFWESSAKIYRYIGG